VAVGNLQTDMDRLQRAYELVCTAADNSVR
jgi:hypothetical protein